MQRRQARRQPRGTDNRGHDPIGRTARRFGDRRSARRGLYIRPAQGVAQIIQQVFMRGDRDLSVQRNGILGQLCNIARTGQRHHIIGIEVARDQINRVLPDRACGPQNTDTARIDQFRPAGKPTNGPSTSRNSAAPNIPSNRSIRPP